MMTNGLPNARIAHVLWNMEIGGAERALFQLVREQRARGIDADVLLGKGGGYYAERARELGARVVELGQTGTYDMSVADAMRSALADRTIVHFHGAELGMMRIAAGLPHVRRFYTHRAGSFRYGFKQRLRYRIAARTLRNSFHGFSGNTQQACDAASRLFGIARERFTVTYNGIDFDLLAPVTPRAEMLERLGEQDEGVVRIGTSANLRTLKRIDRLIDAVASNRGMSLRCYIVGDGPARADLEARAHAAGVGDRVVFTGRQERMGDYLQLFDLFVLPSGPEESFGNSAVEAMGVGIPTIIFSDGGGLVEHVDHERTGFVVPDTPALAAVIARLSSDAALRATIGSEARRVIRDRYSPARMVERYGGLYEGGIG